MQCAHALDVDVVAAEDHLRRIYEIGRVHGRGGQFNIVPRSVIVARGQYAG
jgi:hypothetical protein